MRSRIVSTLAAAAALTVGAAGVLGSALGDGSPAVSHQAGKIMPRGGS